MMAKKTIAIGVLGMLAVFARGGSAEAAEGGSSHYLPGTAGPAHPPGSAKLDNLDGRVN